MSAISLRFNQRVLTATNHSPPGLGASEREGERELKNDIAVFQHPLIAPIQEIAGPGLEQDPLYAPGGVIRCFRAAMVMRPRSRSEQDRVAR
ncbi:uncharacterized protein LAJ45_02835 [Morchella importuna]|uniref:uncharacterized protein n=1 Tax=Morchella importuna TaxID=1174673 RepID=UPI001E8C9EC7|nr:uncharacterized protein LAJ45_02835 [Morchella importuna]KAH8153248.1 hypothetical protein LAJ45_02835 [Morchella importuna]